MPFAQPGWSTTLSNDSAEVVLALIEGDPRPTLLLSSGRIIASNSAARKRLGSRIRNGSLNSFCDLPDAKFSQFLASLSETRQPTRGTIPVRSVSDPQKIIHMKCVGSVLPGHSHADDTVVILRLDELQPAIDQIAGLISQVDQLESLIESTRARTLDKLALYDCYKDVFDNLAVGVAIVGLDGSFLTINDKLCEICGYRRDELLGMTFQQITFPGDLGADLKLLNELLAGERTSYNLDKRYIQADGTIIWVSITVSMKRDAEGRPHSFVSIIRDIENEKKLEITRDLLMGEMNHRVKNTLAVVQGVVQQTMATTKDPKAFSEALQPRLNSIANAYDLLNLSQWAPLSFGQLVQKLRKDSFAGCSERIRVEGADIELSPQHAVLLNLILHELQTNALKHGALSNDRGYVAISSRFEGGPDDLQFRIIWQEHDGPPVRCPSHEGFGSFTLMRGAQFSLNATPELSYLIDGLRYDLRIPIVQPD